MSLEGMKMPSSHNHSLCMWLGLMGIMLILQSCGGVQGLSMSKDDQAAGAKMAFRCKRNNHVRNAEK